MIYFDHNATTPVDERVVEAMRPFQTQCFGNPSSLYRIGRISRDAIENARAQVAALVGAHSSKVIFTSGGTESNNLALIGAAGMLKPGVIACGATEHPSVHKALEFLSAGGWEIAGIPVNDNGTLDPSVFEEIYKNPSLRLVTLMVANNETGVVQDLSAYLQPLRERDVMIHRDAVQAAGKIPVNCRELGAHLMSLSAHKAYGPKGIGALIVDKSVQLSPIIHGGAQERGLRSGTENVAAIVGLGKSAEIALTELDDRQRHLTRLRNLLEEGLEKIAGLRVFGKTAERLPNTTQFGINGLDGEMILMELDRNGIAVSSGSACSASGGELSHVLLSMGVEENLARSAIRVSLGIANSEQDVKTFITVFKQIVDRFMPDFGEAMTS